MSIERLGENIFIIAAVVVTAWFGYHSIKGIIKQDIVVHGKVQSKRYFGKDAVFHGIVQLVIIVCILTLSVFIFMRRFGNQS